MPEPAGPACAIRARSLRKTYDGEPPKEALKGIDLDVLRGSIFGLLGPNGAGKSTFINILAGLVAKTSGQVEIWGHDIDKARRAASSVIGIVPQELVIDPFFTPRETLEIQAGFYGVRAGQRRTDEILDALGLTEHSDAYTRRLSGGMRRRLMVAKAMVHDPAVLVLDEPTAGVDVELRAQLWKHVRTLNQSGTTVVLTTHYLEEAEEMCDRIAIVNHGEVVACDDTERLLARLDHKELALVIGHDLDAVPEGLDRFDAELSSPRRLVLRYRPSEISIAEVLDAVARAGLEMSDMSTHEPDLEDLFLEITRAPPNKS
jgi:ABC-2 type transport system ATP-binding protein